MNAQEALLRLLSSGPAAQHSAGRSGTEAEGVEWGREHGQERTRQVWSGGDDDGLEMEVPSVAAC